jgi:hypothetical protein
MMAIDCASRIFKIAEVLENRYRILAVDLGRLSIFMTNSAKPQMEAKDV